MNHLESNQKLPEVIEDFVLWDIERGINTGSTAEAQWVKLLEEVIELYAALHPEKSGEGIKYALLAQINDLHRKGKIKGIPENDNPRPHLVDAVGDSMKCLTSVANLSGINLTEASSAALKVINARKGSLDPETGIWEKEDG